MKFEEKEMKLEMLQYEFGCKFPEKKVRKSGEQMLPVFCFMLAVHLNLFYDDCKVKKWRMVWILQI